jgi:hypothetical protein
MENNIEQRLYSARDSIHAPVNLTMPDISVSSRRRGVKSFRIVAGAASGVMAIGLSAALIVAFAARPVASSGRNFFSTTSNGNPSLAISEAIEYPSSPSSGDATDFTVDVMVANLYYGTRYDGSIGLLVGSDEDPGYDFRTITISLLDKGGVTMSPSYSVDPMEYREMKNGILREKAGKASKDDYVLIYSFNLNAIFQNDYSGAISFFVRYAESRSDGIYSFGKRFDFTFSKTKSASELSNFKWDYFSDGYAG